MNLDRANQPDNIFRPLVIEYDSETIMLADRGFREKDTSTQNIQCCARGTWNKRLTIGANLRRVAELFRVKQPYHCIKERLEAHLWYLINYLLRLTEHTCSLTEFVI